MITTHRHEFSQESARGFKRRIESVPGRGIAVPLLIATFLAGNVMIAGGASAEEPEPLKVLMITGGGAHDYEAQQRILEEGIGERVNAEFTIDFEAGLDDREGRISRHRDTAWAEEFDLVLYNMCFAQMRDDEWVNRLVLEGHVEHNVPAVLLHCAMHSYSYQEGYGEAWGKFMGVRSNSHERRRPFPVEAVNTDHPVMAHFETPWTPPNGELYRIEEAFDTVTPLAEGHGDNTHMVVWVNEFQGVPVFATTIGHHNVTMEHPNYLNLVSAGLLWAAGKLDDEGNPEGGYARDGFGSTGGTSSD